MRLRNALIGATAAALAIGAPVALGTNGSAPQPPKTPAATKSGPTILSAVLASKANNPAGSATDNQWYDLDILREAVVALGLADAVGGLNNATVFAPTDKAFRFLVADLTNTPVRDLDEAEVLAAVVAIVSNPDPLNGTPFTGAAASTQTVLYHVSPEARKNLRARAADRKAPDITTLTELPTLVPTLATGTIDPYRYVGLTFLRDGDTSDRDPLHSGFSIHAKNGTVHFIDRVLRPLDFKVLFPTD